MNNSEINNNNNYRKSIRMNIHKIKKQTNSKLKKLEDDLFYEMNEIKDYIQNTNLSNDNFKTECASDIEKNKLNFISLNTKLNNIINDIEKIKYNLVFLNDKIYNIQSNKITNKESEQTTNQIIDEKYNKESFLTFKEIISIIVCSSIINLLTWKFVI